MELNAVIFHFNMKALLFWYKVQKSRDINFKEYLKKNIKS